MRLIVLLSLFVACNERPDDYVFPAAESMPALVGPGGPAVSFGEDELFVGCAHLDAGPEDVHDVHNGVYPYRGYGWMPWARDIGFGGLSAFDLSDPCAPLLMGTTVAESMRETHTVAFQHLTGVHAGDWMVATDVLGVQFWRVDNPENPQLASRMELPGVTFIVGSYPRTVHSAWWQYPYLYVAAADNGLFVIDATDPMAPELVDQVVLDPPLRAGFVYAVGTTLFLAGSEEREAVLLDISIPTEVQPIAGGRFDLLDGDGVQQEAYSASLSGHHALFARTTGGAGVMVYDIADRTNPTYVGDINHDGNGGYVFHDEGRYFIGESHVARVIDASDPSDLSVIAELTMEGDLDTLMPYGNVALLSADEEAPDGEATLVVPTSAEPDSTGPTVLHVDPADGAVDQAPTLRLGIGLSEFVEPTSAFAGSVRLYDEDGRAVPGIAGAQESFVFYTPTEPLTGGTYTAELVAGGVRDANDNPVAETFSWSFTVRGE